VAYGATLFQNSLVADFDEGFMLVTHNYATATTDLTDDDDSYSELAWPRVDLHVKVANGYVASSVVPSSKTYKDYEYIQDD
jgi:hypothetical protein